MNIWRRLKRPQFSLRSLMLFVTAAALAMTWPATVMRHYEATERVREAFGRAGGDVTFDYDLRPEFFELPGYEGLQTPWSRWLFGKRLTRRIVHAERRP